MNVIKPAFGYGKGHGNIWRNDEADRHHIAMMPIEYTISGRGCRSEHEVITIRRQKS